jgi:sugar O-acyltransferase (sialic acid O-acetyltransferase NeuD family)
MEADKEKIIIIGSGEHAKVVLYNLKSQNKYEALGYFDSDINTVDSISHGLKVLECYEGQDLNGLIGKYNTNKFIIGFGDIRNRKLVYERFIASGWEAVTIIHPSAVVSPEAKVGKGVLIECGCLITPNPIIGDNVVINPGSQINHDNIIEDHVFIASGVILSGSVRIKENTLLDDGVVVTVNKTVGKDSIIGAGSIVTKDIPDNSVAYGVPAKIIRQNDYNGFPSSCHKP